ncbi:hypothetical protein F1559_000214 [Cyanidiococcus yangmingshanensis]|uniref:SAP domain-containing protein n=1 Tax=Cyanidiococcus yangmingshanensis TaxID=2690220 RepID=A0A7J7IKF2_9RHOD|nr:hypothetical protein F1559_000214 [Cyanidiococcus yangmingshanensis]
MSSETETRLESSDSRNRWRDWEATVERVIRWLPPVHPLWWYRATSYQPSEHARQAAALVPKLITDPLDWFDERSSKTLKKEPNDMWLSSFVAVWPEHVVALVERARPVNGAVVLLEATAALLRLIQHNDTATKRIRLLLAVNVLLRTLRSFLEALAWDDWSLLGAEDTHDSDESGRSPGTPADARAQVSNSLMHLLDHMLQPETFSEATGSARLQSQLFKLAELVVLSFTSSPMDWASRTFSERDLVALMPLFSAEQCQQWVESALSRIAQTPGASFVPLLTKAESLASVARRRADLVMNMLVPLFDVAFRESLHLKRISQKQSAALNLRVLFLGLLRCPHTLAFREELNAALELFGAADQAENAVSFAEALERDLALEQGSLAPWSRAVPEAPTCRQLEDSEQVVRILVGITSSTPLSLAELVLDTFRNMPAGIPPHLAQNEEASRMDPRLRAHLLASQRSKTPLIEGVRNELKSRLAEEVKRRRPVIRAQAPAVTAPALSVEQLQTLGQQAVQRLLQAEDVMELCGATELRLALLVWLLARANYGESAFAEVVVDFIMQDFASRAELALRWLTALAALDLSTAPSELELEHGQKRTYVEAGLEDNKREQGAKRLRPSLPSPTRTRASKGYDFETHPVSVSTATTTRTESRQQEAPSTDVVRSTSSMTPLGRDAAPSATIRAETTLVEPSQKKPVVAQSSELDETRVKQMTVAQLKAELEKRQLDTKGLKKVLLERLLEALATERQSDAWPRAVAIDSAGGSETSPYPDPRRQRETGATDASRLGTTLSSDSAAVPPISGTVHGHLSTDQGSSRLSTSEMTFPNQAQKTDGTSSFATQTRPTDNDDGTDTDRKRGSPVASETPETILADSRYERLLDVFLQRITSQGNVSDTAFAQFLADLCRVPPWIYPLLSQMAKEPRQSGAALAALRDLVCNRYGRDRLRALDTVLGLVCSDDELVRGPASRLLADTLFAEHASVAPLIAQRLQSWMLTALECALDDTRESSRARLEWLAMAYMAAARHDISLIVFFVVELYARAAVDQTMAARLVVLLADRALFRWSATDQRLVSLIRDASIPATSLAIDQVVASVAETLQSQGGRLPSAFTEAVWQRFQAEQRAHLLLPVLGALSPEQAHEALPHLVQQLEPAERRLAWERLVIASGRTPAPFTASGLVEALHWLDTQRHAIALKRQMDAVQTCFELESVFPAQCWASALQNMVRSSRPLPLMIMRSLLQVLARYPKTHHWMLQLLSVLVERRIWEYPKLWPGFLRACVMLMPQSATVVIAQLPRATLEQALNESADLRDALTAFAEQHQGELETAELIQ